MTSSHRQILRSSAIIGSTSVIGILLAIIRLRIAASAVGPVGIGLIGLLQNFVTLAGALAAMGIGSGGARQIAAAWRDGNERETASVKRTIWLGGIALALAGASGTWAFSVFASTELLSSDALAADAPLLALAAALTVIAAVQIGLLSGARRLGDIGRVNIIAGILATIVTALAFPLWPERAIIVFVVAAPLLTTLVGQYYVRRRDPLPAAGRFSFAHLKTMLSIGSATTTSLILSLGTTFFVRGLVHEKLGSPGLGFFQASWSIATMYLGVVLHAMATDYLPRLSQASDDTAKVGKLVNEQAEVLILIGGPIVIGMIGAAPLVMWLLYGPGFEPAIGLLRIQLLGAVPQFLGWPIGYVLLATAATKRFVAIEVFCAAVCIAVTWLLIGTLGLAAIGWGYVALLTVNLIVVQASIGRLIPGFRWDRSVVTDAALLLAAAIAVWLIAFDDLITSTGVGCSAALLMGWRSYRRLKQHFPDVVLSIRHRLFGRPQ